MNDGGLFNVPHVINAFNNVIICRNMRLVYIRNSASSHAPPVELRLDGEVSLRNTRDLALASLRNRIIIYRLLRETNNNNNM